MLIGLIAAALVSIPAGCFFGPLDIPVGEVLRALANGLGLYGFEVDPMIRVVVMDIRLSRVCLSFMVGAALALSGSVFQGILQNPLADPFTIGVSTGAAFGASLAIFLGLGAGGGWAGLGLLPLAAMAGAFAALAAVIALGRIGGGMRRESVILAGIITAAFLSALIGLLKSLDEESLSSIVFWVMGGFQGRSWPHLLFSLPYFLVGGLLVFLHAKELDILSLGDSQARLLGLEADRTRLVLLLSASLITGAAVSVSGVIGFVGLAAPHLVRMTLGSEHGPLLAFSCLVGGTALLWSDAAARTILPHGEELPVGVITALAGGPFFCLLLKTGLVRTRE